MSTKTKSLVFGYFRSNYRLYVPEVIIKICILYFDPEVIMKFKGKDLQKYLESPNGHCYKKKIKFNQQLSFFPKIQSNGACEIKNNENGRGFVVFWLVAEFMIKNVDYYAICYEILCVETQSFVISFQKVGKENNYKVNHDGFWLSSSECKQQKELTFKFIIHSLEIKYKTDENENNPLIYPSLKARILKQETSLKWNVDMEKIKSLAKRQKAVSQMMDNWNFQCWPKGYDDNKGIFAGLSLRSFPLKISKMVFIVKYKIIINSTIVHQDESDEEFVLNDYNKRILNLCIFQNDTIELEQIENMTFNATVVIKQLYDLNDVEVPFGKWENHNVQISNR